jgi:cytochrome c-type biogenesis protein CcmE
MPKYAKFGALIVVIVGTLVWLAFNGAADTKTYYKTISELGHMGNQAYGKTIRVAGDVEDGSIQKEGKSVVFTLKQDKQTLKVAYIGDDPLPDTFRGGAQALADGKLSADGVFRANKIQAKCASKYTAKPTLPAGQQPSVHGAKSSI